MKKPLSTVSQPLDTNLSNFDRLSDAGAVGQPTGGREQGGRDELVDFSIFLGQHCWNVYRRSKVGFVRVFMLPSDEIRDRASNLFQLGFSARMLFCPPTGIPELDALSEKPVGERTWRDFLANQDGKVVLDGPAYPETPAVVLRYAKEFFLEGFRAGTLAVRTILNS